jgi:ceramide synthetase
LADRPFHFPHGSSQLRLFYAWQMGHYVYGLVDQLVWESRRKDHAAMVVHHGATLALLSVSFAFNFLRVGALIEVLHDACDVWMEAAKLNVYLQWSNGATVLFVVFMAAWVLLRMAYFPLVIIRSTCLEAAAAIMPAFGPTPLTLAVWGSINALLLVLLALHCYWFYFIVLIAVRTAKGDPADVRSDDEGDDSPAASPRKAKAA